MGLYNGWNALGIGQTVENGLRNRLAREQSLWDRLGMTIGSIGKIADGVSDWNADNAKRDAALKLAEANGVETGFADAVSGQDYLDYVLGQKADKEKEERENAIYQRDRGNALADRQAQRGDTALDKGFATVSQNLQVAMSKARSDIPTAADLAEYEKAQREYDAFVRAHPEYGIAAISGMQNGWQGVPFKAPGSPKPLTMEDYFAKVQSLEKGGAVNATEMQALKDELIDANVFATLSKDPDFQYRWDRAAQRVVGDKATRDSLMLGAGAVKTEGDAKKVKQKQDAAAAAKVANDSANAILRSGVTSANIAQAQAFANDDRIDAKTRRLLKRKIQSFKASFEGQGR